MATVIVERTFRRPRGVAELGAMMASTRWCMTLHGVAPRRHYLGVDGRRVVCVFDAPDAEPIRGAVRSGGLSMPARIWTASIHSGPGRSQHEVPEPSHGTLVVVERSFSEPVRFGDVQAQEDASRTCFDLRGIAFLRSYFSIDRLRMLCLYVAPDAEAVREANLAARLPFDLAWPATVLVEPPSSAAGSGVDTAASGSRA